ncbi:helix-turn-helix domain-containing protein [Priestia flexa]
MNDRKHVGKLIQNLRNIANLSQEELSSGICSKEELDLYEAGAEAIPGDILYKISKRLGVTMNYFLK